ncbi:hypothetical protein [Roseivirga pacifica]|uniref:hypothetical protein n=1 Tax=Roseivirga pacifica TaxID=1267423 RepID=UPI0020947D4F|nr:hypothetical protein [Roseivirga pacifica]MCO6360477.1 hypothetical protein [Roseivirga pacifica]MCO6368366.1 hypothetical protein [Roseivirga pacifica]MCO6372508.1 hypothetical protein [Roseivirga pacifica]MCO6376566.1 hypothetical protein [Roseivirga pacifica]MCO6378154.1 hypothetical protein [Roseivirga pacifica]
MNSKAQLTFTQFLCLVDNPSGSDCAISSILELFDLEVIELNQTGTSSKEWTLVKGKNFNEPIETEYAKLVKSLIEGYISHNSDPKKIKRPPLTPLYLLDNIYSSSGKSWGTFKKEYVLSTLIKLGYLEAGFLGSVKRTLKGKQLIQEFKGYESDVISSGINKRTSKHKHFQYLAIIDAKYYSKRAKLLKSLIKGTNQGSSWNTFWNSFWFHYIRKND